MHLNPDIFSDIIARQENICTRLDPRSKLVVALAVIACVILSKNVVFPLVVLIACLSAMIALRIPLAMIALRLASPLGIVGVLIVLKSVLTNGTQLWQLSLPFIGVTVTYEGVFLGLIIAARVLGAVSVVLLLSFVTPAHQIFSSIRWLRVPHGWVELAVLMYRYLFLLLDIVGDTTGAQRVRLGYRGLRRSLRSAGIVAGTIVLRSVDQAARTHEAMIMRGYRGTLHFEPMAALPQREGIAAGAAGTLVVVLFLLCERSFA